MHRRSQWVHGTRLYRNVVIQVRDVKHRGAPTVSVGWEAKIEIGNVTITTNNFHGSQDEAEMAIVRTLNEWIEKED